MTQKVLRVGSSAAVTIPKQSLAELGLKVGDSVRVAIHPLKKSVIITPEKSLSKHEERVAALTIRFIDRYRSDIDALAKV